LVLVSSGGVSREVNPMLRLAATPLGHPMLSLLSVPFAHFLGRRMGDVMKALHTDLGQDADDWLRVFESVSDPTARRAFVSTIRAVVDFHGQVITMLDRCYLARGMPTLIVWGRRDAVIPFEHAEIAHVAMPGSRLECFEGAGHFPHHADTARFVAVLREFIANTAPAAYSPQEWRELLRLGRPGRNESIQGALTTEALAGSLTSGT
jgi:pimeloyl-ACP methyl ester carboxylesterase